MLSGEDDETDCGDDRNSAAGENPSLGIWASSEFPAVHGLLCERQPKGSYPQGEDKCAVHWRPRSISTRNASDFSQLTGSTAEGAPPCKPATTL